MVKTKILIPDENAMSLLCGLKPPLHIHQAADNILRPASLLLVCDNAEHAVRLKTEYRDVVFKFEIFNILPSVSPVSQASAHQEIEVLAAWNTIRCIFAFEWERPSTKDEVPPLYEQIVGERGARSAIPNTATAVGVSMVGISFHSSVDDRTVGMIYTDTSVDPTVLLVSRAPEVIENFEADCEIIDVEEFPRWKRSLVKWRSSRGARPRHHARNLAE